MKWLAIVLTAIFVIAKLMNVVAWSWWLVFTPAIIYLAFMALVVLVAIIVAVIEDV